MCMPIYDLIPLSNEYSCRQIREEEKLETVAVGAFDGIAFTDKYKRATISMQSLKNWKTLERQDFKNTSQLRTFNSKNEEGQHLGPLNCCGLEWLLTIPPEKVKDSVKGPLFCSTPTKIKGVDLFKTTSVWDPGPVKNDGALICSCENPKQFVEGLDKDGKPNCVDKCSAGYARRGAEGDENDECDRCRFYEYGAYPLALDPKCTACKAGDNLGLPDICTKCTGKYYLKASQGCVKDCGEDAKGGVHLGFRNVGGDEDGRTCEACDDTNCNKCADNAKVCTECTNDYHLQEGECVKSCPSKLKLKQCSDTETFRDASEKDADYLWRFVPTGGKRDSSTNILTGSACKETVVEDRKSVV